MLTERRDYLLRLIQQAAAAARRLRELLTQEAAAADEVAREANDAIGALLGGAAHSQLLERVDAETAVRLLADPERVRAWVELLRVQGDALRREGAESRADWLRGRALALDSASKRLEDSLGN